MEEKQLYEFGRSEGSEVISGNLHSSKKCSREEQFDGVPKSKLTRGALVVVSDDLSRRAHADDCPGWDSVLHATLLAASARVLHAAGILAALAQTGLLGWAVRVDVTFWQHWLIGWKSNVTN